MKHTLIRCAFAFGCIALLTGSSSAGLMKTYNINYEQDGDYPGSTLFGTIGVSENGVNQLKFVIDLNESVLGPNPDIQQFGFTVHDFSGSLSINSVSPDPASSGFTVSGPTANGTVVGIITGQKSIDYVIDFGNGGYNLEPVEFNLLGTSDFGFDNLNSLDTVSTNGNKANVNFALHVQNTTSPAISGSEALAGIWDPFVTPEPGPEPGPQPGPGTVPEPTTIAIWSIMGLCGVGAARRKRAKQPAA